MDSHAYANQNVHHAGTGVYRLRMGLEYGAYSERRGKQTYAHTCTAKPKKTFPLNANGEECECTGEDIFVWFLEKKDKDFQLQVKVVPKRERERHTHTYTHYKQCSQKRYIHGCKRMSLFRDTSCSPTRCEFCPVVGAKMA